MQCTTISININNLTSKFNHFAHYQGSWWVPLWKLDIPPTTHHSGVSSLQMLITRFAYAGYDGKAVMLQNNLIPIATDKKRNSYFDLSSLPNPNSHSVFFVLLKISSLSFSPNKTKQKVPTEMCVMSASGLHFGCRISSNSLVMGDAQILSISILAVLKEQVSWTTLQLDSCKWTLGNSNWEQPERCFLSFLKMYWYLWGRKMQEIWGLLATWQTPIQVGELPKDGTSYAGDMVRIWMRSHTSVPVWKLFPWGSLTQL